MVGGRGEPVDLDHFVLPLDALSDAVAVTFVVVTMAASRHIVVCAGVATLRTALAARSWEQLHPAFGAAARCAAGDLRMHRARVPGGAGGSGRIVHLGDQRQRLVRRRGQVLCEAVPLGDQLRRAPQHSKSGGKRRLRRLLGHRDRA
jgi:hypothetical protein